MPDEDARKVAIDAAKDLIKTLEDLPDRSYFEIKWKKTNASYADVVVHGCERSNPEIEEIDPLARVVTIAGYQLMGINEEIMRVWRSCSKPRKEYSRSERQVITKIMKKV